MTALAAPRKNFSNKSSLVGSLGLPAAATKVFYSGALVAWNATGFLVPATTTAGFRVAGIADLANRPSLDTTGLADGDKLIDVKFGIFPFINGTSTDALTQADAGNDCYVLDDQTVSRLPGAGRPVAGQFVKFEGTVPYVAIGIRLPNRGNNTQGAVYQGPGSVEVISAAGALSVATEISTLAVTGTTAYTLANGLFLGQRKSVTVVSGASTPVGTVTAATPSGHATVTALGAVGDTAEWIWAGAGAWYLVSSFGCTIT